MIDSDAEQSSEKAAKVEVDKEPADGQAVRQVDALIGFYPATIGSEEKPCPSGTLKVTEIDRNPTYRYNPAYDFKGVHSHKPFTIRPGPNNPVGSMWINLSRDGDPSVDLLLSQLERRRRQRVAMDAGIDERIQNIISGQAPSQRSARLWGSQAQPCARFGNCRATRSAHCFPNRSAPDGKISRTARARP